MSRRNCLYVIAKDGVTADFVDCYHWIDRHSNLQILDREKDTIQAIYASGVWVTLSYTEAPLS